MRNHIDTINGLFESIHKKFDNHIATLKQNGYRNIRYRGIETSSWHHPRHDDITVDANHEGRGTKLGFKHDDGTTYDVVVPHGNDLQPHLERLHSLQSYE